MAEIRVIRQEQTVGPIGVIRSDQRTVGLGFDRIAQGASALAAEGLQSEAANVEEAGRATGGAFIAKGPTGELVAPTFDPKTVYGRAAQNAALTSYYAEMDISASGKASTLSAQLMNDPEGPEKFKDQWRTMLDGAVEGSPAQSKGHTARVYGNAGQQTYNGLLLARTKRDYEKQGQTLSSSEAQSTDTLRQLAAKGLLTIDADGQIGGDPAAILEGNKRRAVQDALVDGQHLTRAAVDEANQRFNRSIQQTVGDFGAIDNFKKTVEPLLQAGKTLEAEAAISAQVKAINADTALSPAEQVRRAELVSGRFTQQYALIQQRRAETLYQDNQRSTATLGALNLRMAAAYQKAALTGDNSDLRDVVAEASRVRSDTVEGTARFTAFVVQGVTQLGTLEQAAQQRAETTRIAEGNADVTFAQNNATIAGALTRIGATIPAGLTPDRPTPRQGPNADSPGAAAIAAIASPNTLSAGETVRAGTTGGITAPGIQAPAGEAPAGGGMSAETATDAPMGPLSHLPGNVQAEIYAAARAEGYSARQFDRLLSTKNPDQARVAALLDSWTKPLGLLEQNRLRNLGMDAVADETGNLSPPGSKAATALLAAFQDAPQAGSTSPTMQRIATFSTPDIEARERQIIQRVGVPDQHKEEFDRLSKSYRPADLERGLRLYLMYPEEQRASVAGGNVGYWEALNARAQQGMQPEELLAASADAKKMVANAPARAALETSRGKEVDTALATMAADRTVLGTALAGIPGAQRLLGVVGVTRTNDAGIPLPDGPLLGRNDGARATPAFQSAVKDRTYQILALHPEMKEVDAVASASREVMSRGEFGLTRHTSDGQPAVALKAFENTAAHVLIGSSGNADAAFLETARQLHAGERGTNRPGFTSAYSDPFQDLLKEVGSWGNPLKPYAAWNPKRSGYEMFIGDTPLRDARTGNARLFQESDFQQAYMATPRFAETQRVRQSTIQNIDAAGLGNVGDAGRFIARTAAPEFAALWASNVAIPTAERWRKLGNVFKPGETAGDRAEAEQRILGTK